MNNLPTSSGNTIQNGNKAGGHIAGRDVILGDQVLQYSPIIIESKLAKLYRRLKEEAKDDHKLLDFIEDLTIFTRTVPNEEVIGLDRKLHAAQRDDQIEMAMYMKERIYGSLCANKFSLTFQTIYATLMSKIWEQFNSYVQPAIVRQATRDEIDKLVNTHVIEPIVAEINNCDAYDGIAITEIRGMLYFLTGNCHIKWV